MIITRIESIPLRIPFKPDNHSDAAAWGDKNLPAAASLLVKVTTDQGLVGRGEAEWCRFDLAARIYGVALKPERGRISVPQGSGMGIDPDPDVVRAYRRGMKQ
jgi:L-alanine-DL-glutamate epimerase-like enolase superfamily enzyme